MIKFREMNMTAKNFKSVYNAPIGKMIIASDGEAIIEIDHVNNDEPITSNPDELCNLATKQLDEYFAGTRIEFDLPLKATKGTDFQKKVWAEICKIESGKVLTYKDIARNIGRPKSSRAVANACGKNPYIEIIPCHRVIRSDGFLGGYSGVGGIKTKQELLISEGYSDFKI